MLTPTIKQTIKRTFPLLLGMLLLIVLVACAPAKNQLAGTNWTLVTMDGAKVQGGMTLNFSADTISGSDGCNTFTGGYEIKNGALVIADNLASTAMACPDKDTTMSQKYLDALLSINNFKFKNDSLAIQTKSSELVFARAVQGSGTTEPEIGTMVNRLVSTNWKLVSIDGVEAKDGKTLTFGANKVSGSDGCNTFSSDYTIGNGTLKIADNIVSTMLACPDMDTDTSRQYLNALVSTTTFTLDKDSLTLQAEKYKLVFAAVINTKLDGTRWQLNSLVGSDGNITRMPIDSNIFIMFAGKQVNGSGGCNRFSSDVTTDPTQMRLGNIASTLMACVEEGVSQRETDFYAALDHVATYEIVGQTLTMYDAGGKTIATFTAAKEMVKVDKLMNTLWQWVRFEDSAELHNIDVDSPASYTIQFMADGTYALQADCNRGNGSYTHDESALAIDPGILTLAACGEKSLGGEFVRFLGDVATYAFDKNGNLILNLTADAGNMVLTAAE